MQLEEVVTGETKTQENGSQLYNNWPSEVADTLGLEKGDSVKFIVEEGGDGGRFTIAENGRNES